jgi:hypothetical protein
MRRVREGTREKKRMDLENISQRFSQKELRTKKRQVVLERAPSHQYLARAVAKLTNSERSGVFYCIYDGFVKRGIQFPMCTVHDTLGLYQPLLSLKMGRTYSSLTILWRTRNPPSYIVLCTRNLWHVKSATFYEIYAS